ncbi:MAG: hypothetical protein H0X24_09450 [Ktedonobacterales bacterium]|nr:hypothetical protein [Ktedonobacterales bacterium]
MNMKRSLKIAAFGLLAGVLLLGGVLFSGARSAFAGSTGTIPAYQMIHLRAAGTVPVGEPGVVAQQPFAANPGGVQLNAMVYVPASMQNTGTLTCALSFDATDSKSLLEVRTVTLDKTGNELVLSTNQGYTATGSFIAYVQCSTTRHTPLDIQVALDLTVVTSAAPFKSGTN